MADLIVYHPAHGLTLNQFVYVSWLNGNYYIGDPTTDSYKLTAISSGVTYVQYTSNISSGYVRLATAGGSSTISGLDHLEGESVTVVSGGQVVATAVVASGSISVPNEVTEYIVGLPYTMKIRTTRLEVPAQPTIQSRIKRITETVIRNIRTKDGKAGQEYGGNLYLSEMKGVFSNDSKDITIPTKGGFTEDAYTTIISDTPFPMTVLQTVISFEVEEVR